MFAFVESSEFKVTSVPPSQILGSPFTTEGLHAQIKHVYKNNFSSSQIEF